LPRKRIIAPKSIGEVINEMGDLYREARRGRVDTLDASRMSGILGGLRQAIESESEGDLRERVAALEASK
jgi:hypothetical protein